MRSLRFSLMGIFLAAFVCVGMMPTVAFADTPNSSYTVYYESGESYNDLLPSGWEFSGGGKQIQVGTHHMTAHDGTESVSVTVHVKKGIPPGYSRPSSVTVYKGDRLSNSDLPSSSSGRYVWTHSRKVSSSGNYGYKFIPKDSSHYQTMRGSVYVTAKIKDTYTPTPAPKPHHSSNKKASGKQSSGGNKKHQSSGHSHDSKPKQNRKSQKESTSTTQGSSYSSSQKPSSTSSSKKKESSSSKKQESTSSDSKSSSKSSNNSDKDDTDYYDPIAPVYDDDDTDESDSDKKEEDKTEATDKTVETDKDPQDVTVSSDSEDADNEEGETSGKSEKEKKKKEQGSSLKKKENTMNTKLDKKGMNPVLIIILAIAIFGGSVLYRRHKKKNDMIN